MESTRLARVRLRAVRMRRDSKTVVVGGCDNARISSNHAVIAARTLIEHAARGMILMTSSPSL